MGYFLESTKLYYMSQDIIELILKSIMFKKQPSMVCDADATVIVHLLLHL